MGSSGTVMMYEDPAVHGDMRKKNLYAASDEMAMVATSAAGHWIYNVGHMTLLASCESNKLQ